MPIIRYGFYWIFLFSLCGSQYLYKSILYVLNVVFQICIFSKIVLNWTLIMNSKGKMQTTTLNRIPTALYFSERKTHLFDRTYSFLQGHWGTVHIHYLQNVKSLVINVESRYNKAIMRYQTTYRITNRKTAGLEILSRK